MQKKNSLPSNARHMLFVAMLLRRRTSTPLQTGSGMQTQRPVVRTFVSFTNNSSGLKRGALETARIEYVDKMFFEFLEDFALSGRRGETSAHRLACSGGSGILRRQDRLKVVPDGIDSRQLCSNDRTKKAVHASAVDLSLK